MRPGGDYRARRIIDIDTQAPDRHCPERTVVLVTDDPMADARFRVFRESRR